MEFLRVAGGEAATPLAVLRGDDGSLEPRARALSQLAVTLTSEPWAVTPEKVAEVRLQGLDQEQVETAVGVISMFNYFTRVADATGIEFDYLSPLPAFEPDLCQVPAARPARPAPDGQSSAPRRPVHGRLQAVWKTWRAYVLGSDTPISQRERRLLAAVAAEESTDWAGAEGLGGVTPVQDSDDQLIAFGRKLSRQPWSMGPDDLEGLRALGYPEEAILHVISVIAHQNADSRFVLGLAAAS